MAENITGKPAVQVRLTSPATEAGYLRTYYTWVSTELKPKIGMVIVCPPDKTEWTVDWAGTLQNNFEGLTSWKTR